MQNAFTLAVSLVLLLGAVPGRCGPVEAKLWRVRDGLGNVLAKLEQGEPVKIAYLGGSITEANGWRPMTLAWFRKAFPRAKIEEVYACLGGTGSDLGVFRMDHDVLPDRPDLLFVEFAVNDRNTESDTVEAAMEGIVRKAWASKPEMDICFVYSYRVGMEQKSIDRGECPRVPSVMEHLADHYGIPSINFALRTARREREGAITCMPAQYGLITKRGWRRPFDWQLIYRHTMNWRGEDRQAGLEFRFRSSEKVQTVVAASDGIRPATNTWQHVALVRDGELFTLYLDGERKFQKRVAAPMAAPSDAPVNLGILQCKFDEANDVVHGFEGQLDDVAVFRGALDQESVADLASGKATPKQTAGNAAPLVTYWPLDPSGGERVFDASENRWHGMLVAGQPADDRPSGWRPDRDERLEHSRGCLALPGGHVKSGQARYVAIPDAGRLDLRGDFTLSLWVRARSWGADRPVFSFDGVHPFPGGHAIYAQLVAEAVSAMREAGPTGQQRPARLPPPSRADNMADASMVPLNVAMLGGHWKPMPENEGPLRRWGWLMTPRVWKSDTPGDTIEFAFRGSSAALWSLGGPDAGQLAVSIDGKRQPIPVNLCGRFSRVHRPLKVRLASGLDPDAVHTVALRLLPDPDRTELALGLGTNAKRLLSDPRYQGRWIRASHLMLRGELVQPASGTAGDGRGRQAGAE